LQNLTKLLGDYAPGCCKEQKLENYFGRKIAVDASMHIYQFLVRYSLYGIFHDFDFNIELMFFVFLKSSLALFVIVGSRWKDRRPNSDK
jgi:hypothetical protein